MGAEMDLNLSDIAGASPSQVRLHIGLSAVIQDADGGTTYWALAHAPGKPDFHHPDSFAFTLEPA